MRHLHSPAFTLIFTVLFASFAAPTFAVTGDWVNGDKARVRLIAADVGGRLTGAIEIELAPGWKTYWRTPGAAGIAPVVDFSTSSNVSDVVIRYPIPHRYDDGYAISNVYEGRILLPLEIATGDASTPVDLRLSLDIGVCEIVCIPAHYEMTLTVPPGVTDPGVLSAVAEARTLLPGPPERGILAAERIVRHGGTDKRPEYLVTVAVPTHGVAEVYVEGPQDWYAATPVLVSSDGAYADYRVAFDRLGARTPLDEARFVVTIVTPDRAIEQAIAAH
ncbi:MAG: hypothetical protein GY798_07005 [Hyphomicrobiales bacterium]|nr:hypothetical protein [Hyphomicrobiales bacterium]